LQPRAFHSFRWYVSPRLPARKSRVACHSLVHLPTEHAFHASWSGMFLRTRQKGNNAFPSCCRHALICAGKCLLSLQPHGWHASRLCVTFSDSHMHGYARGVPGVYCSTWPRGFWCLQLSAYRLGSECHHSLKMVAVSDATSYALMPREMRS
jgi:hypothetical protein